MANTRATLLADTRLSLQESVASIWSDANLYLWMALVAREIAERRPIRKRAYLAVTEYTTEVQTSGLTDLIDIVKVEFPASNSGLPLIERDYELFGTVMRLDLDAVPTIDDDTLTGTVTFTINSRSVTGSGTAFTTELTEGLDGDFIGVSSGTKYYQVAEVISDTSLTLHTPFEETTAPDTVNVTKVLPYNNVVKITYGGTYTIDGSTFNIPEIAYNAELLGTVAYAVRDVIGGYSMTKLTAVTTALTSAITATAKVAARVTQAVTDIGTERTNLGADITSAAAVFADIETDLDRIATDLGNAVTYVNTLNRGGDISTTYIEMAKTSAQSAEQRVAKMRGYLEKAKTSADYLVIADNEIKSATAYINESQENMRQAEQEINSAQLISSYRTWANQKWQEYQTALQRISRVTSKGYMNSRSL